MHHIIYMSQAPETLSMAALVVILMQARANNERAHITGALVYGEGQFMQVIEGQEAAVTALYERIARDPRHQSVFKLADKAVTGRRFSEWSMAFSEVDQDQFKDLAGYVSPAQLAEQLSADNAADSLLLTKMLDLVNGPSRLAS